MLNGRSLTMIVNMVHNVYLNMHPITSSINSMLEHVIVSSILKHLDAHQILTDCQHGFRARRSCETQLLTLAHELLSSLDVGYISTTLSSSIFQKLLIEYNMKDS